MNEFEVCLVLKEMNLSRLTRDGALQFHLFAPQTHCRPWNEKSCFELWRQTLQKKGGQQSQNFLFLIERFINNLFLKAGDARRVSCRLFIPGRVQVHNYYTTSSHLIWLLYLYLIHILRSNLSHFHHVKYERIYYKISCNA